MVQRFRQFLILLSYWGKTTVHKFWVGIYMGKFCFLLLWRAVWHDSSKYGLSEAVLMSSGIRKMEGSVYGSVEYKELLAGIQPAIDHHYLKNRHHPEHFERGIRGMGLLDIVEMFCDWKAAVRRHSEGNKWPDYWLRKSIELNSERFQYGEDLREIFFNSMK